MPAGNDAQAALSELADRFAAGDARAEDLREANKARVTPELREAQLKEIDADATNEVDWDKAAKAAEVDPEAVLDVAVRGDQVVVVYEDARGDQLKAVGDAEAAGVELSRPTRRRRPAAAQEEAKAEEPKPKPKAKAKRSSRSRSKSKKKS